MGHYLDFSNSLHIYGENIGEVKEMFIRMKNRGELFDNLFFATLQKN